MIADPRPPSPFRDQAGGAAITDAFLGCLMGSVSEVAVFGSAADARLACAHNLAGGGSWYVLGRSMRLWGGWMARVDLKILLSAFAALAILAGCRASFTPLPPEPRRSDDARLPGLSLETNNVAKLQVGRDDWIDWRSTDFAAEAAETIRRSGWIAQSDGTGQEPAIRGTLIVRTHQGFTRPGISPFTAFLIPSVTDTRIELELNVRDEDGGLRSCTRSYAQRAWNQVLLVFAYPFRSPVHRKFQATNRLALGCLLELFEERTAQPLAEQVE